MRERMKKDKKFRRNVILAGICILVLIIASCYTVFIKPRLSQETYVYKEESVQKGGLVLGIMERGSVTLGESSILYDLDLDTSDDEEDDEDDDEDEETTRYLQIDEVFAVSGQRISDGDVLFKLNDSSVTAVRRKLTAALAEAQIALSEAQTEYNISLISAQNTYDTSTVAGNRAAGDYQASLTRNQQSVDSLRSEIKVLELEITQAQEMLADEELLDSYDDAKTAYTQAKNKYEETDLHNSTAYTSNLSDYQTARQNLEQIEEQLQGYRDTISHNQEKIAKRQSEIQTAESNKVISDAEAKNTYECAKLEGELAGDIYGYSTGSLSDAVTEAQNDLDEMQEKADAFEAFVGADNTIYADGAGLVTQVSYSAGDKLTAAGAMLTYAKEEEYTVSIDISEEDIAAVKVGDTVELDVTAYPDTPYKGTIVSITTSATSEHASTISYPVTIHVEGDTSLLYGGMTADVTFVTDSVEDVLYISKKAVFSENGVSYVYRQAKNGSREQVQVETGFSDGIYIEIKSGLEENETVYIKSKMKTDEKTSGKENEKSETDNSESVENGQMPEMGDFPEDGNFPNGGNFPDGGDFTGGDFPGGDFSGMGGPPQMNGSRQ